MLKYWYPEIAVYLDYAVIEGQIVNRPSHISRSSWLRFWEHAQRAPLS